MSEHDPKLDTLPQGAEIAERGPASCEHELASPDAPVFQGTPLYTVHFVISNVKKARRSLFERALRNFFREVC